MLLTFGARSLLIVGSVLWTEGGVEASLYPLGASSTLQDMRTAKYVSRWSQMSPGEQRYLVENHCYGVFCTSRRFFTATCIQELGGRDP